MTALARAAMREKRGIGRLFHFPVEEDTVIYKGAIVAINADGYAIPATDTAALVVAGIAHETVDNTGGADAAKKIRVQAEAEFLFTATSITQAMVGEAMVVVDDNTVDDAAGATNDIPVGKLTEFVSTTRGWVYVAGLSN